MSENTIISAIVTGSVVSKNSGKVYETITTGFGNTGRPEFNKFTPSYINENGVEVNAKFRTTLFVNEETPAGPKTHKVPLTLWGELAKSALKHLGAEETDETMAALRSMGKAKMDRRTAKLRVINATKHEYFAHGEDRVSFNVNLDSQLELVELREHGNPFDVAAARMNGNSCPF